MKARKFFKEIPANAPIKLILSAIEFGRTSDLVAELGGIKAYLGLAFLLPFLAVCIRILEPSNTNLYFAASMLILLKIAEFQFEFSAKSELKHMAKERVVSGIKYISLFSMFFALSLWFFFGSFLVGSQ